MRRIHIGTVVVALSLALPVTARAQNAGVQGFGGLTFGDVTASSSFGGGVAVAISDNLQIVGEGGRMTNVTRSLLGTIVDLTPFDVRVAAWHGEGGIRLHASRQSAVNPYAEATAGFARLSTTFSGAGSFDPIVNGALGLFNRTEPLLGVGGGVVLQGGPVFVDLGYRYKKIFAGNSLQSLLTGSDLSVNQVRVGVGVRF